MPQLLTWLITVALLGSGLFGTLIPVIPGVGFIFLGILFYAIVTGFADISAVTVVLFGVAALFLVWVNYVSSAVGAKLGGGKTPSLIGTFVGAAIGIFFGPVGLFIGAFLGALVGALYEGQSHDQATKVALLAVIGGVGGIFIQFLLGLIMIAAFFAAIFL